MRPIQIHQLVRYGHRQRKFRKLKFRHHQMPLMLLALIQQQQSYCQRYYLIYFQLHQRQQ